MPSRVLKKQRASQCKSQNASPAVASRLAYSHMLQAYKTARSILCVLLFKNAQGVP
ncbi:copper tolerance protein [Acetobacter orientalis]|uniref:Copper tolerance protein n=1 Tax=Acetobacter orientalis TaxID=146474 RepID=A0A2Z5ZH25_9PROT|nr:copper tolerance protein [Acetobacter orientalis]